MRTWIVNQLVSNILEFVSRVKRDRDAIVGHTFRDRQNLLNILARQAELGARGEKPACWVPAV